MDDFIGKHVKAICWAFVIAWTVAVVGCFAPIIYAAMTLHYQLQHLK